MKGYIAIFAYSEFRLISVLLFLSILFGCDEYDLPRTNQHDPKNTNYIPFLPVLTTAIPTAITYGSAITGGNISDDGGGNITARGVCWASTPNPDLSNEHTTDATGADSFISSIEGLMPVATYYVRAYATNEGGTSYGNEVSFTTPLLSDTEGNVYSTVKIGTQVWMSANLKTTRYSNGASIYYITDNSEWMNMQYGAYCWHNNDISNKTLYGALYNWYAVDTRMLCPKGWHVPTDDEWTILTDFAGGQAVAGAKLKSAGTIEAGNGVWNSPNTNATNEYGFGAVPGGSRNYNGIFSYTGVLGIRGDYFSSTIDNSGYVWLRSMFYDDQNIERGGYQSPEHGSSVRCIKD